MPAPIIMRITLQTVKKAVKNIGNNLFVEIDSIPISKTYTQAADFFALSSKIATAGSGLPSKYCKNAPPPVEI